MHAWLLLQKAPAEVFDAELPLLRCLEQTLNDVTRLRI